MKVAYIIKPFESTDYLIRCINSIYRQKVDNYYVILAENNLGINSENIETYLKDKKNLIRIPNDIQEGNEKIRMAISLVPEDADYVMFLTTNTVLSAELTTEVLKIHAGSNLIFPEIAVKDKQEFIPMRFSSETIIDFSSPIMTDGFFIAIGILKEVDLKYFFDEAYFRLFLIKCLMKRVNINYLDTIGCYISEKRKTVTEERYFNYFEYAMSDFDIILKCDYSKIKVAIFKEFLSYLKKFVFSEAYSEEEKVKAFEILKKTVEIGQKDYLLNMLVEGQIGCTAEAVLNVGLFEYITYVDIQEEKRSKALEVEPKFINEIRNLHKEMNISNSSVCAEVEHLKQDIAMMNKNIHYLSQEVAKVGGNRVTSFVDPINEIPVLFGEGKLGFSIILKSIRAWFKFKFHRKNK